MADYWDGIKIVDISDLNSPVIVGSVTTNIAMDVSLYVEGSKRYAVVADEPFYWEESGLKIVDITDVNSPKIVGENRDVFYSKSISLYEKGEKIYVVAVHNLSGIQIVELS